MASPKYSAERFKRVENVFDKKTKRNIFKLASEGYFEELGEPIALGKEANVFTARREDDTFVVVKIYRVENGNFNKMYQYISGDKRFDTIQNHRRKIVFSWVKREYRNLMLARDHVNVPTPYEFKDNILVMELIGDRRIAPQLKDAYPDNEDMFFKRSIRQLRGMIKAGLVHADLSQFNILNFKDKPVFIDMGQATPFDSPNATDLFERDLRNFKKFHSKFIDEERIDHAFEKLRSEFNDALPGEQ
jgi:RIO kinase 1